MRKKWKISQESIIAFVKKAFCRLAHQPSANMSQNTSTNAESRQLPQSTDRTVGGLILSLFVFFLSLSIKNI